MRSGLVKKQLTMQLLPLKNSEERLGNHLSDCHCVCASVFLVSATPLRNKTRLRDCFVWDCFVIVLANSPERGIWFSMWSFDSSRFWAFETGTRDQMLMTSLSVKPNWFSFPKSTQKRRVSVGHI